MRQKWLRIASLFGLLGTLLGMTLQSEPAQAAHKRLYVPGEVIVKLVRPADLPAVARAYNLRTTPRSRLGARAIYRMAISDGVEPPRRAAQLMADPQARIVYAEPNYFGEMPESRQRSSWATGAAGVYTTQWASDVLQLVDAHKITRGAGVTVAVLDTGADRRHPALMGRLVRGYDFVGGDTDPNEVGVYGQDPAYGHGTHVAGLVALAAPEARILPVRVLNRHGIGTIWALAQALDYAVDPDRDPNTNDGADVINLSLSTRRPTRLLADLLRNEICADDQNDPKLRRAGRKDVIVIAAAGNSGTDIREYPAAELVPGKMAVAASTEIDTLAAFSTYGTWVNIAAPGQNILSSVPGGGYGSWSGTSMATPLTAGVAALVRANRPSWSAAGVARHIQEFAATIEGPVSQRVDAAAALTGGSPILSSNGSQVEVAP